MIFFLKRVAKDRCVGQKTPVNPSRKGEKGWTPIIKRLKSTFMWKYLLGLSSVFLIGASALTWLNIEGTDEEKPGLKKAREVEQEKSELATTKTAEEKDLKGQLEEALAEHAENKEKADELIGKVSTLETEATSAEEAATDVETEKESNEERLGELKEILEDVERVKKLRAQYDSLKSENAVWESRVASLESQLKSIAAQSAALEEEQKIAEKEKQDIEAGNLHPGFVATIAKTSPEWGFVVLNRGARQGALPKGTLAVVRGGGEIARLKITNAERGRAIAEIVRGSLAPGANIAAGDRVVAVRNN